jgi:hypothetical protein
MYAKKIKDYLPGEAEEEVKKSLRYVFALIGIKAQNIPGESEKAVLIEFIISELGRFSPSEIVVAFRLAVKGELDIPVNHFQSFSSFYLCQILKAYETRRIPALKSLIKAQEELFQESRGFVSESKKKTIEAEFLIEEVLPLWRIFESTGRLDFSLIPPRVILNSLKKLFHLNPEDPAKIQELAKDIVLKQLQEKSKSDLVDFKIKKEANSILSLIKNSSIDEVCGPQIDRNIAELSILQIFQKLKDSKINFEQDLSIKSNKLKNNE